MDLKEINTDVELDMAYRKIHSRLDREALIVQGGSMLPTLQPNTLQSVVPMSTDYLVEGVIYVFQDKTTSVIRNIIKRFSHSEKAPQGTIYHMLGDNRESSVDHAVFVRDDEDIKTRFKELIMYPNVPIKNELVQELKGGK